MTNKSEVLELGKDVYDRILNIYYRRARKRFYSEFVTKGDLCFDIGANKGNRTDIFLLLGAKVICVEPQVTCMLGLQKKYRDQKKVVLINKALGEKEGIGSLFLNQADTLASMSKEWIDKVEKSGRLSEYQWEGKQEVAIITLDSLIKTYGNPKFCKIDVEGFEYQVLLGLSKPINSLSFEFAFENLQSAINCIRYLRKIGNYIFNYSVGEEMCLALKEWESPEKIQETLNKIKEESFWGDIYARIK